MRYKKYGKFMTGPSHIFNPPPISHEEAVEHGNALAASGNYPVGTSDCFNVGIAGGCGLDCFVFIDGECPEEQEVKNYQKQKETKNDQASSM